jgi:hypothetical protein
MKRKGISDSYKGKPIYHLAFDPDETFRSENLDDEFVEENFRPLEEMTCVLDTTMASDEIIKKFEPYFKFLKSKMLDRINVQFVDHRGEQSNIGNHLCIFYLVDDGKGNPGLTLDKEGGEILIVEEEKKKIIEEEKAYNKKRKKKK